MLTVAMGDSTYVPTHTYYFNTASCHSNEMISLLRDLDTDIALGHDSARYESDAL
jgi:hypothetical protein